MDGKRSAHWVELEVSPSSVGPPVSEIKDETTTGTQLLAGVEYAFGQKGSSVGNQYPKLNLGASLGPEAAGRVDAGGILPRVSG